MTSLQSTKLLFWFSSVKLKENQELAFVRNNKVINYYPKTFKGKSFTHTSLVGERSDYKDSLLVGVGTVEDIERSKAL